MLYRMMCFHFTLQHLEYNLHNLPQPQRDECVLITGTSPHSYTLKRSCSCQ